MTIHWESFVRDDYLRLLSNLHEAGIRSRDSADDRNAHYGISFELPECLFSLTPEGLARTESYIRELSSKRKEILDAGKDTAGETSLPTVRDILDDIGFAGMDERGEYYDGWSVTDHYDADYPLLLKIGRDFLIEHM